MDLENNNSISSSNDEVIWKPLHCQVGGHQLRKGKSGKMVPGVVDIGNGFILKALQDPPRGPRELNFYEEVCQRSQNEPDIQGLLPFLPGFHGSRDTEEGRYLKLSNVTSDYQCPCVMDIKMGRVTYDQDASPEKIAKERKKFPPAQKLGFTITGMVMYDPEMRAYEKYDKHYTRALTEETIISNGLDLFFRSVEKSKREVMLKILLGKLHQLENWFSQQTRFSFIASSLLVIYDGQSFPSAAGLSQSPEANGGDNRGASQQASDCDIIKLYFVDFSHVFPSSSIDHNVLFGIQKLISCLQQMLK